MQLSSASSLPISSIPKDQIYGHAQINKVDGSSEEFKLDQDLDTTQIVIGQVVAIQALKNTYLRLITALRGRGVNVNN